MDIPSRSPATDVQASITKLSLARRLAFGVVIYFIFLLLLAAIEIGTRLTLPHVSSLDLFVVTSQQKAQVADSKQSGIFEGDPLLLWRLKPNLDHAIWDFTVLSTNAEHLRTKKPNQPLGPKRPGTTRVVCLGDSVTFGYRVPPVWPEKPAEYDPTWLPYPMLLEKELRSANPGQEIEVITMAVPGYTSHQGLAWLRRDIDELKPDLITISFGWNDASYSDVPDHKAIVTTKSAVAVRWLIDNSQAFAHATRWLRSTDTERSATHRPAPRVYQPDYVNNFLAMVQLARERRIAVIVIAAPYRDVVPTAPEGDLIPHYRESLRTAMQAQRVPFLQVLELTEKAYPSNEGWFGERIHPNHMGHRLMASELLILINSSGGLKDLKIPALTP
ncbi:MAG TPA: SGNH/GDSL hydrolase family protein [Pyrinomonadaceae bacterium]|nr:SGNH/GDSL hydrolase family protein [Pyrinomonadaceae bacterium]